MHPALERSIRSLLSIPAIFALSACTSFGSGRLDHDQVDYALALSNAAKRQALYNIVRLRYADAPSFLQATQIIAAYQFDIGASSLVLGAASNAVGNSGQIGATLAFNNNPTFTFTPITGQAFAAVYIRPLAPALILPMAESGAPIDVLFRLAVQSVNGLRNSAALGGAQSNGMADFFELTFVLRRLQIAGALAIHFVKQSDGDHVFMTINGGGSKDPAVVADAQQVYSLLHLNRTKSDIEIVYGDGASDGSTITIVTRSVLGILSELGAQIDVPEKDVASHNTLPTVHIIGVETRPTIVVRVGDKAPDNAFVTAKYGDETYWIARDDFDSKFAFSLLQELIDLAQVDQGAKAPIVTIPAG